MRALPTTFFAGFLLTLLAAAPPAFAACDFELDGPDCPCFIYHPFWNPSGAWIQDVAQHTVGIEASCVPNGGQPYYEMVVGCTSQSDAMVASYVLWLSDQLNLPSPLPGREAWCSETVAFWHKEAGIPYPNGYHAITHHHTWRVRDVSEMRSWYEAEEENLSMPFPFTGRGRWISDSELDYESFELGVTVPVPGSYMAIRNLVTYGDLTVWDGFETAHSLMIDRMRVHVDVSGDVFQVEAWFLEGKSGNRVRNTRHLDDLLTFTPAGTGWINPDKKTKIYCFGIDLSFLGEPNYDPSRLEVVHHPAVFQSPYLDPHPPDVVDLLDVYPMPIQGIELRWSGMAPPRGYRVQFAGGDGIFTGVPVPDIQPITLGGTSIRVPIAFADESGTAVRYVRFLFPVGSFQSRTTLEVVDRLGYRDDDTVRIVILDHKPACRPGAATLCLSQSRFAVEVEWTTRQGTRGRGQGMPLTGDTGAFWFFDPSNVEMVVKVLDACSFAGRFWVFAGGLTDVELALTVTDTETGESKTFRNHQKTAFQPIQDTAAFATCP